MEVSFWEAFIGFLTIWFPIFFALPVLGYFVDRAWEKEKCRRNHPTNRK